MRGSPARVGSPGMSIPTDPRGAVGRGAEDLAAAHLRAHGLTVLGRNVRCRAGEIDLVCHDGPTLVMVEVRLRTRIDYGGALASIGASKRRKIMRATRYLLRTRAAWGRCRLRFDVVGIQGQPDGVFRLEWIRDAFRER